MKIDWINLPYNHRGRWTKVEDSVMNPSTKVTWPQLVAEFVIFWRSRIMKDYKNIRIGPDWSKSIQGQVRLLNHQSNIICNYFAHPDDDPLVKTAFKNYFRKNHVIRLGGYRKHRTKTNPKTKRVHCTVTQAEKDLIAGLMYELERLQEIRSSLVPTVDIPKITDEPKTFRKANKPVKKSALDSILDLEAKELNNGKKGR